MCVCVCVKKPKGEVISFSSNEEDQLHSLIRRLQLVGEASHSYMLSAHILHLFLNVNYLFCQAAERHSVSVLMDAEQTYFQKAIEHFTLHLLSMKHNQADRPHPRFYNTLQTYLTVCRVARELRLVQLLLPNV